MATPSYNTPMQNSASYIPKRVGDTGTAPRTAIVQPRKDVRRMLRTSQMWKVSMSKDNVMIMDGDPKEIPFGPENTDARDIIMYYLNGKSTLLRTYRRDYADMFFQYGVSAEIEVQDEKGNTGSEDVTQETDEYLNKRMVPLMIMIKAYFDMFGFCVIKFHESASGKKAVLVPWGTIRVWHFMHSDKEIRYSVEWIDEYNKSAKVLKPTTIGSNMNDPNPSAGMMRPYRYEDGSGGRPQAGDTFSAGELASMQRQLREAALSDTVIVLVDSAPDYVTNMLTSPMASVLGSVKMYEDIKQREMTMVQKLTQTMVAMEKIPQKNQESDEKRATDAILKGINVGQNPAFRDEAPTTGQVMKGMMAEAENGGDAATSKIPPGFQKQVLIKELCNMRYLNQLSSGHYTNLAGEIVDVDNLSVDQLTDMRNADTRFVAPENYKFAAAPKPVGQVDTRSLKEDLKQDVFKAFGMPASMVHDVLSKGGMGTTGAGQTNIHTDMLGNTVGSEVRKYAQIMKDLYQLMFPEHADEGEFMSNPSMSVSVDKHQLVWIDEYGQPRRFDNEDEGAYHNVDRFRKAKNVLGGMSFALSDKFTGSGRKKVPQMNEAMSDISTDSSSSSSSESSSSGATDAPRHLVLPSEVPEPPNIGKFERKIRKIAQMNEEADYDLHNTSQADRDAIAAIVEHNFPEFRDTKTTTIVQQNEASKKKPARPHRNYVQATIPRTRGLMPHQNLFHQQGLVDGAQKVGKVKARRLKVRLNPYPLTSMQDLIQLTELGYINPKSSHELIIRKANLDMSHMNKANVEKMKRAGTFGPEAIRHEQQLTNAWKMHEQKLQTEVQRHRDEMVYKHRQLSEQSRQHKEQMATQKEQAKAQAQAQPKAASDKPAASDTKATAPSASKEKGKGKGKGKGKK